MASFWADKAVVVTGGAGFLGSYVVRKLRERGCREVFAPRSREYDLRDMAAVIRLHEETHPHIVIHLAATVGGIGASEGIVWPVIPLSLHPAMGHGL